VSTLVFLLMMAASMVTGPALKVVTELMAKGVVQQDEGVAKSPVAASGMASSAPTAPAVPVLASASAAPVVAVPSDGAVVPAVPVVKASLSTGSPPVVTEANKGLLVPPQDVVAPVPSATLLALIGDTPTRRPDSSVFVPVTLQRIFGLRTEITKVEQFAATQAIAGRIVTNRDVNSMIQATQTGVIESVDGDTPRVGDKVTKGQLLAFQRPVIDAARQVDIDAKVAELRGLINMGEQRIARLQDVMLIRYRQSKIDAVETEVENYRRQLRIYSNLGTDRTEIRARSSGVISRVNFVAGQIVDPQTTLFEIVDPTKLWVEATSFDASLANDIARATAVTGDGQVLRLRFTGGGLILQNQAVPLQFEVIDPVANLQIGRPVTVIVERQNSRSAGIRLPGDAVLHGATGETMVWERLSAEVFTTRPVSIVPLDGKDVIVTSGLTANMRIVTADSQMLSQVR
jgi:hypothetical protein